jgi:hypothetical protein
MGALTPQECVGLARRAALARAAVLSPAGESESVVLWEDEDSIAWLNVAHDSRDTGFHDHDGSAVGVYVVAGSVTNEGLRAAGPAGYAGSGRVTRSGSRAQASIAWTTRLAP